MNITRIRIENLRSIASLDLDLVASDGRPRRRVILLGGNGCGKTTILAAIAHAIGRDSDDLGAHMLGVDDVRQARGEPAEEVPQARWLIGIATSARDREWWTRSLPAEKPPETIVLPMALGRAAPGVIAIGGLDRSPPIITDVGRRAMIAGPRQPPAVLLPADRGTLGHTTDISITRLGAFQVRAGCLSSGRERFALVPGLLALAYLAPDSNDRDGTVRHLWKVLAKYFPEMPRPARVGGLQLLFETRDGAILGLERLSDGQRALLLILGELALRNPAGGIVLIDEIEQHLHPRWQRALLDALLSLLPTTQFIITTQAPYVAACAPDDVITLGDWTRDGPLPQEDSRRPGAPSGLSPIIAENFGEPARPTLTGAEAIERVKAALVERGIAYDRLEVSAGLVRRDTLSDAAGRRVLFPAGRAYDRCMVVLVDCMADALWAHPAWWAFVPADGDGPVELHETRLPAHPDSIVRLVPSP